MNYRVFDNYQMGFSHVKNNSGCEDYAASYMDPDGQFYICVACDGHSDNNCFRSAKGAKFGCEAGIEILKRFFELYNEESFEVKDISEEKIMRLKKSIKLCWDNKVFEDLQKNPISEKEMEPLSERVRSIYGSGRGLQNIYGATFVAMAINKNCFVALHIGDGVLLCVDADGTYYEPLCVDEKGEAGSPASLCDSDIFTRENAFRVVFSEKIPQAVIVSSDGIGDSMDQLQFMEFFHTLIQKFESLEQKETEEISLNDAQMQYLESCVKYWADKGNGVEDDCSLAGIYTYDLEIPKVKIPLEQADKLWHDTFMERNEVIADYEKRKKAMIKNIDKQWESDMENLRKNVGNTKEWFSVKEKIENLKQIVRTIEKNEQEKLLYYDARLRICEEYIRRANGVIPAPTYFVKATIVDEKYRVEDDWFTQMKVQTLNGI